MSLLFTDRLQIMHSGYHPKYSATLLLCGAIVFTSTAMARQTSLTGALGTGFDFRDRTYDQNRNSNEDQQKIFIKPTITITSQSVYDQASLQYSPSFNYDFVNDENSVDHYLNLNAQRMLTSRWMLSLSNRYIYSDDPATYSTTTSANEESNTGGPTDTTGEQTDTGTQDTLSRDQTGRRYWTNAAGIRSSYALFENTTLGGGYTYSLLRNEKGAQGSNYDEYDKHAFFTDLKHAFNANWRSSLNVNYTRGLYDTPPSSTSSNSDLNQYWVQAGVDYVHSNLDLFPLQYNFLKTDYDATTRRGTTAHEWSLGWSHFFDPHTQLAFGGGPSYAQTEGLDGMWSYNAYLRFSKKFQHTTCSLQFDKTFETNNFSGTDESGLQETYNARVNLTHQYTKDLGLNMFARYSKQSQIDPQGIYQDPVTGVTTETGTGDNTYDKNIYEGGVGVRYAFGRWYSAGLKYSYYVSDGQLESDQYDEHRVILSLEMSKEFFRW